MEKNPYPPFGTAEERKAHCLFEAEQMEREAQEQERFARRYRGMNRQQRRAARLRREEVAALLASCEQSAELCARLAQTWRDNAARIGRT